MTSTCCTSCCRHADHRPLRSFGGGVGMVSRMDSREPTGGGPRRRVRALLAVLSVTASLLTGATESATAGVAASPVPVLNWAACGGGFECARAVVPLDYGQPRGMTISLALIRLPASDRRHRIGSLLINPGGPGASGVSRVREGARQVLPPAVRARFDVVGF